MAELKSCPCCGKKDQIKVENGWKHGKCDSCGFACSVQTNDRRVGDGNG